MTSENSPLKLLPLELSRKQVLIFDGIRYAAEMTDAAYQRLFEQLQDMAEMDAQPSTADIAKAMLDAWSIVDSVHRFRDLVGMLPGLANRPWKRLLQDRTNIVAELRNCVQHQINEVDGLITNGGQIWGYLSWAEVKNGAHTGKWIMMSPGAVFAEDTWWFMGPVAPPIPLPLGRIRLNAFGRQVYLGQCVQWVSAARNSLTLEVESKSIRLVGNAVEDRRGSDLVSEGMIMIEYVEKPQESQNNQQSERIRAPHL